MNDDVTRILSAIHGGDPRAAAELLPLVYDELRKLAAAKMTAEAPGHTLQPKALVHEAYLRLVGGAGQPPVENQWHAYWDRLEEHVIFRVEAADYLSRLEAALGPQRGARVLDFGCGCGRVLRHWAGLEGPEIHGSDYNERLVAWCAANLPFVTASVNELEPPLRYEDRQFGLVYAISVFTHLPRDLERAWIEELSRIVAPGGLLLLTTHGDSYADRLDAHERARYDSGEPVARWPGVAGSNLCTTFHPESYVRERLAPALSGNRAAGGPSGHGL